MIRSVQGNHMADDVALIVARLMELSARTAPKAKGEDFIELKIFRGDELDRIGKEMLKIGEEKDSSGYRRDGQNVLNSDVLLMVGLKKHPGLGTDCRACGYDSCREFNSASSNGEFKGPNCIHRVADLGIALGSAAKTASIHNIDNRIMVRAGDAARRLSMIESNVGYGIPLSVTGKNIFFDRKK